MTHFNIKRKKITLKNELRPNIDSVTRSNIEKN